MPSRQYNPHRTIALTFHEYPLLFLYLQIRLSDIYHLARSVMSGKSLALPSGWWPHEATRRLAVLCVATVALLFARLQIMGSQLPVFTR